MTRSKNTLRNIWWGFAQQAVILLFPFIIRTLILRILGSEYLGLSSLFSSILNVLNMAELGFSSAIIFSMYEPIAKKDRDTICALLSFYKKTYAIIGTTILGIGIILMPFLKYLINGSHPEDVNLYILYSIYLLNTATSYFMYAYKSSILVANQRNDLVSKISIVINITQYTVQIIVLGILKNYYLYIIFLPISTVVNNFLNSWLVHKYYPEYICKGEISAKDKAIIRKQVKGLLVSKICGTLRNSLDSIIISAFLGLTAVAIYSNYYYIMSALHGLLTIIGVSMKAGIGNSIVEETKEKNYRDFEKFTFIYAWISGWCFSCLFCLYQSFMLIWTDDKEMLFSNGLMAMFCVYFFALCMSDMRNVYIDAIGLWWEARFRSVLESVANLILNITLGYYFGVFGIVLATLITMIVINLIYGTKILFDNYFNTERFIKYFFNQIIYFVITCIATIACYWLCSIVPYVGLIALIYKGCICTVVTNVLFVLIYHRTKHFRETKEFVIKLLKIG